MSDHKELPDEDVVVIEQRDKRTYFFIVVAGVLGLALAGLLVQA